MLYYIFINSYYFLKENILYLRNYNNYDEDSNNNIDIINTNNYTNNYNQGNRKLLGLQYNNTYDKNNNTYDKNNNTYDKNNNTYDNNNNTYYKNNNTSDININIFSIFILLCFVFLVFYLCNIYCNYIYMKCFKRRTLYINYNTLNNIETENINNNNPNTSIDMNNSIDIDSISETINQQYNYVNTNYVSDSIDDLSEFEYSNHNIENLKNNISKMFFNNENIQKKIIQHELYFLHLNNMNNYSYLQKSIGNNNTNNISQESITIQNLPDEYLNTEDVCSICLDDYKNNDILHLDCDHLYHDSCFLEWVIKQKYNIIHTLNTHSNNINFDDVHIYCPECKKRYPKIKNLYSRCIE